MTSEEAAAARPRKVERTMVLNCILTVVLCVEIVCKTCMAGLSVKKTICCRSTETVLFNECLERAVDSTCEVRDRER